MHKGKRNQSIYINYYLWINVATDLPLAASTWIGVSHSISLFIKSSLGSFISSNSLVYFESKMVAATQMVFSSTISSAYSESIT